MRVDLDADVEKMLDDLVVKLREKYEFDGRRSSLLVSQIIADFCRNSGGESEARVAEAATSPDTKRRAIIRRMVEAAGGADLTTLEKSYRKLMGSPKRPEASVASATEAGIAQDGEE